jgi:hypothetical protein
MAKRTLMSSAASFAHLFGRGAAAETTEDDKDEKGKKARLKGESDEDYAKRMEKDCPDEGAQDDGDDESMEGDDVDTDEDDDEVEPKKGKKGKKAKKAEKPDADDEDADGDDDGNEEAEEKGRKAERARWTSVMQHPSAGGGRVATACTFLATTDLTAKQIVNLLKTTPEHNATGGRGRLADRMERVRTPNPGGNGGGDGGKGPTMAEQIVLAGKKRRGEV